MTRRPSLTLAELEVLFAVIGFAQAGEADGGPLAGDGAATTARNYKLLNSAADKLAEMADEHRARARRAET